MVTAMATRYRFTSPAAVRALIRRQADIERGTPAHGNDQGLAWFAGKIGTTPAYLANLLNGHRDLTHDMGIRIAKGLEVDDDAVYETVLTDEENA